MTQANDILRALLSNFPAAELPSGEPQKLFETIRTRLGSASDATEELKNLYKVNGFSDFATGLMWMVDRAMRNPGQVSIGPEDETLLLSTFRRAVAARPSGEEDTAIQQEHVPAAGVEGAGVNIQTFAGQVEQFSDAVQSGSGGIRMLLEDLIGECDVVVGGSGGQDLIQFATLFREFLKYLSEGDLFDDVRVINILSNVSSTVSQWANTPPEAQADMLEEALNLLQDFKTHFE